MNKQTKNISTTKEYRIRGASLMSRAYSESKEAGQDFSEHVIEIDGKPALTPLYTAAWAKKNWSSKYRKNTWRKYRSSIIFMSEQMLKKEAVSEIDHKKTIKILKSTSGGEDKLLPLRTSSKKRKNLSEKDYAKLSDALHESKNKWAKYTLLWFNAAILTGLRPTEWKEAEIIKGKNSHIYLKVKNAKNTNERAFGEFRTLSLSHLNPKDIKTITDHISVINKISPSGLWETYYTGCSNILRYTARKSLGQRKKYPSLYTGRHIFSSNMKSVGCTTTEIAALMGHASEDTAQIHYGKKRYGNKGGPKPVVYKNDLQKVRKGKDKKFQFK